ncbi:uncharacterized protein LOC117121008 [Anneissia japonica]|nr:uncharacterized protein LOC117121008 [Anneissia japonica]
MYLSLFIMIVVLLLLMLAMGLCYRKYTKNKFHRPEWLVSHKYTDMCSNVPFHKDSNPMEVFDQLLSPSDKKLPPQNRDRPIASSELEPVMITLTENVISDIEEQSIVNTCSYAKINFEMMSKIQEENNLNIENKSISVIPAETSESSGMSCLSKYSTEQYVKADFGFPVVGRSNDSGYVTNRPMPIITKTNYLPVKTIVSGGSPVQTQVLQYSL